MESVITIPELLCFETVCELCRSCSVLNFELRTYLEEPVILSRICMSGAMLRTSLALLYWEKFWRIMFGDETSGEWSNAQDQFGTQSKGRWIPTCFGSGFDSILYSFGIRRAMNFQLYANFHLYCKSSYFRAQREFRPNRALTFTSILSFTLHNANQIQPCN